MLPFPMARIDAAAFQTICAQRFSESSTLDFKLKLPGTDEKGKNEFAKDVCAMANADGGDLVYGIEEDAAGGTAKSVQPLTGETYDEASRRLVQTLDSWVEPRIQGIDFKNVQLDGGYGLIVRVPASFDGPHCVRNTNSQRRFVLRNGTVTSDMTYDQIRNAFSGTASLAAQARAFVELRQQLAQQAKAQKPMSPGPIAMLDFVPLSGMAGRTSIDVKKVDFVDIKTWDGGASPRINLDGIGAFIGEDGVVDAQSLLFRNGCMEYMRVAGDVRAHGTTGVWSTVVLAFFNDCLTKSLQAARKYSIAGPALVSCSLLHVQGSFLYVPDTYRAIFGHKPADRPLMVFPEIYIEDVSNASASAEILLIEMADLLYQAFGYSSAPAKT